MAYLLNVHGADVGQVGVLDVMTRYGGIEVGLAGWLPGFLSSTWAERVHAPEGVLPAAERAIAVLAFFFDGLLLG